MENDGDGRGSRSNQNSTSDTGRVDIALNATGSLDATLTPGNQSTVIAGIQRFPPTNKEIAQRLGISLKSVEKHITKALKILHQAID